MQKKWYLLRGYKRRKIEWNLIKPVLAPTEADVDESGDLKIIHINP
jgi:hypothetical protein